MYFDWEWFIGRRVIENVQNTSLQFKRVPITYYWVLPIAGVGKLGILLSRRAERPFCSSTDALVSR